MGLVANARTRTATMPQRVDIETRLANWEGRHGFAGVASLSGRSIYRMCVNPPCGRATASLAQTECAHCERRSGKRTRDCEQSNAEAEDDEAQSCVGGVLEGEQKADEVASSVATLDAVEAAEAVKDVLAMPRQRQVPRRPTPADPCRYLRCRTKECGRIAKHRGTLCPKCWIAKDPDVRACPTCKRAPRCNGRKFGTCSSCNRNVERAVARLWQVAGGQMAIACSALAKHAMDEDNAHEADQLLEALEMGAMASLERADADADADADAGAFDDSSL